MNQIESLKAQVLNELDTYTKEESNYQACEKELNALEKEKLLHIQAIESIEKDLKQVLSK